MQSKNHFLTVSYFLISLVIFLLGTQSLIAQDESERVGLRLVTGVDCLNDSLSATIQIRSEGNNFFIGTSSLLLNYDASVLEFLDYTSINFDEKAILHVQGLELEIWEPHNYTNGEGEFNLTLLLEIEEVSEPRIDTEWIDIGKIRFSIKDKTTSPQLVFDRNNTNFNRNIPNDGTQAPTKGTFTGFEAPTNSLCNSCDFDDVPPILNNFSADFTINCDSFISSPDNVTANG